jgi:apolipoprotein N-acyltransferase
MIVTLYPFPFALLSGLFLVLSFPRYGHPAFAWIALVPLAVALIGQTSVRAFVLGLLTGLVYFIGTVYWTGTVVSQFGGLATPVAMFAMVLLAAYLALFPALTALIMARLIARAGVKAVLFLPAAWVATEFMRGYLFGGFPWVPLGNSQVEVLPVAQLASLFGVYGLSALVAGVNGLLAYAALAGGRQRLAPIAAVAVMLIVVGGWGAWRIADGRLTREGSPLQVGLIQGNIAQEDKWKPTESRRIFTTHVAMTRDVVRRGADFVIWPESSTPFMFEEDDAGEAAVRELAREVNRPILFGSEQVDRNLEPIRLHNSAFMLAPNGDTAAVYHKIQLVPFGEFFPLQEYLAFVAPLVERFAPFAPGASVALLPIGTHLVSTAICYEVVFPWLTRQAVNGGSELLTTITNDGWYGRSSAPYQHFAMASMRAIEHGRYLARAANTGISGVVDPYGRIVAQSAIFEEVGMVEEVRLLTGRTLYTSIGDAIAYAALALTAAALLTIGRRRR